MAKKRSSTPAEIVKAMKADPDTEWTSTRIRETAGLTRSYAFRVISGLVDAGAIEVVGSPKGSAPWVYRVVPGTTYVEDFEEEQSYVPPTADELQTLRKQLRLGLQATVTGIRIEGDDTIYTLTTERGSKFELMARGKSS